MSDGLNTVVLALLGKIDKTLNLIVGNVCNIKLRVTGVEVNLASVQRRIDRLLGRVERFEKRLGLSDGLSDNNFADMAEKFRGLDA